MNRRRFLQSAALSTGAAACCHWPFTVEGKGSTGLNFHRWFVQLPTPKEVWVLPFASDIHEGMILESAMGLAALALRRGHGHTLIYEQMPIECYQGWFRDYCAANSPKLTQLTLDAAVARLLKERLVRGYILFHYEQSDRPLHSPGNTDESANVATSLAAKHRALTVSEPLAERMEKLGLRQIMDARERGELWCLSQDDYSRTLLGTSESRTRHVRSLMIAHNAFVCCARGKAYQQALARCVPDSPVLGWGCEAEDKQTLPSSEWGLFQTATNWCYNLTLLSSDRVGKSIPAHELHQPYERHWSSLDWGDGRHHVNFTMSDGDNVQWVMGNFIGGYEGASYYGHPKRGSMPFSWGLPVPSLCQVSPRTLKEIMAKATPNDDFMQFSGGGYFYPDRYGKTRGNLKALELHAQRLRAYFDLTGIRILAWNFQNWDNADARRACEIFAEHLPGLLGIFAFQYYPYSAGEGAIHWVKGASGDDVPIVSCRLTIWSQTGRPRDTTPAAVAAHLNKLPTAGPTIHDAAFSWVMVHAWSRFRQAENSAPLDAEEKDVPQDKELPGTARGYSPASWAVERLEPNVKPVTASELLQRVRLRLRPEATLKRWLAETEAHRNRGTERHDFSKRAAEVRALLSQTNHDPIAAQRCFELLRGLWIQTTRA